MISGTCAVGPLRSKLLITPFNFIIMKREVFNLMTERNHIAQDFGVKMDALASVFKQEFSKAEDLRVFKSKMHSVHDFLGRAIEVFIED